MRRTLFLAITLLLAVDVAAQSRQDSFDPANVITTEANVQLLPDGGCSVRWCGRVVSDDAGVMLGACTPTVELQGATNRTRCLQTLSAGDPKVRVELRLAADGGVP